MLFNSFEFLLFLPALWIDHLAEVCAGIEEHAAELNAWGPVGDRAKSVSCIKDILALVNAHGATPVLITTPYHPSFLAKIPREKLKTSGRR